MYLAWFKRGFDIVLALLLLGLLSPLLLLLALLVRVRLGSPIFFVQARPGLHGELFRLVKFRSMTDARDEAGCLQPDEQRLPVFGRFLRATSLDELPEIWNVLVGDMSIAGPRPLLVEYLPLYSPKQMRRHEMRPGLTGWAQVNGRNALSWERKFELDVWYVDHCTFALDLRILWMTMVRVLRSEGISAAGQATAERFRGAP